MMLKRKTAHTIDVWQPNKSIAQILKEARLQRGHKLSHVAETLNIDENFLKAFEAGQLGRLPPQQAYALGFLRSYAQYLELDPFQTVDRFKKDYQIPTDESLHVPSPDELRIMSFFDSTSKNGFKALNSKALLSFVVIVLTVFVAYKILISVRTHLPTEPHLFEMDPLNDSPRG